VGFVVHDDRVITEVKSFARNYDDLLVDPDKLGCRFSGMFLQAVAPMYLVDH
jgi:hypothetical protein